MSEILVQRIFKGKNKKTRKPVGYIGCTKVQFSDDKHPILLFSWSLCHKTDKWDAKTGRELLEHRMAHALLKLNSLKEPIEFIARNPKEFPITVVKNYHKMVDRAFKYYKIDAAFIAGWHTLLEGDENNQAESDEIREKLEEQAQRDEALLRQALDALIWTTGSDDFGEGGLAREGAVRLLFPTIAALRERLRREVAKESK